ncbi:hypothetical protein Nepgr_011953 [Nepenthes gracilis]|uniref:RING-type domain-containing protein n=1 Tax=Nepenthes gracilis TaxID=150966 RepID=A0AAD3SGH1_NEPGR|nr:hypothetical protein Nepgr_011953 [Nepenthes gracilis]
MDDGAATESIITAALSTLPPSQLVSLSFSLFSTFHRHHRRLSSLLSSPTLFSHTLNHLYSLPLQKKSLLIARHLLSTLHLLTPFFPPHSATPFSASISRRDLDAALLLLLFCEIRQHDPKLLEASPPADWHRVLTKYFFETLLSLSGIKTGPSEVLGCFIEILVKCKRLAGAAGCRGGKARRDVPASAAVVVAPLPSVEVGSGGSGECVICREEMAEGREACELPCGHLFHWSCVLRWLTNRNTCPCCRLRLPSDDVSGEIDRLLEGLVRVGRSQLNGDQCI